MNPIHTFPSYLPDICFNIILPSTLVVVGYQRVRVPCYLHLHLWNVGILTAPQPRRNRLECLHRILPLTFILSQMNSVHTLKPCSLRSIFILYCYLRLAFPNDLFLPVPCTTFVIMFWNVDFLWIFPTKFCFISCFPHALYASWLVAGGSGGLVHRNRTSSSVGVLVASVQVRTDTWHENVVTSYSIIGTVGHQFRAAGCSDSRGRMVPNDKLTLHTNVYPKVSGQSR
jgi:hypothetical protein